MPLQLAPDRHDDGEGEKKKRHRITPALTAAQAG